MGRGVAVPVFVFKVSDLLAVREALGHPSVDIQPISSEVRDIVARGLRIAEYWMEIWYHRSDEERMAQPNRSAHYRQRIETLRRMRERFETDGYSAALLDQGYDLYAAGEFGGRFGRGIKLGSGSENYSRYWQIGQWAETAKTGNPTDTDTGQPGSREPA